MRYVFCLMVVCLFVSACAMTPEAAEAKRFEDCMDATLGSFGPIRYGTQEQRLKAAEICRKQAAPAH